MDVKGSNDKTVEEVIKVSARGQKRGKTMPTRQLSTSTRRAKQAPVTQSKSPVKSEPGKNSQITFSALTEGATY